MTAIEAKNKMFQEVFDMIPESYRERYGIRLITAGLPPVPCMYLEIEKAKLAILNRSNHNVSVEETQESLCLKVEGSANIFMYKNFTCIYTHL